MFDIIYADPPWKFGGSGGVKWAPADHYYQTLSFEELESLKVKDIANDNCLLFMWVVSPEIPRCIQVAQKWGFKYITIAFIWHKRRANVGNYTMPGCEVCLLFKRGKIPSDRIRNPGQKQFYETRISSHSNKPEEFRIRIEKMFPKSSKIELFATSQHDGWVSIGFKANNQDVREFLGGLKVGNIL